MFDSIQNYKCFRKEENGFRRPLIPVLHPTRPVWDCPIGCPSRFRLNFTRLTRIHDGRTRNTVRSPTVQTLILETPSLSPGYPWIMLYKTLSYKTY